jgi:transcriptional antiterminator NusG
VDESKERLETDAGSPAADDAPLFQDFPEEAPVAAPAPPVLPPAPAPAPVAFGEEFPEDDEATAKARRARMRWFVLHANTGHENKVKRNIEMAVKSNHMERHFGEVLVATQEVTEMKNGKRATVKRKFFPSYILIEMEMTKETFHFISSIPGVTRFIGGTELRPEPIGQDEVDRILGRMSKVVEAKTVLEIPYDVGDSVQVVDGPFTDWIGVINEINHDKGKLKVMISIFGSETPVELDFLQLKAI